MGEITTGSTVMTLGFIMIFVGIALLIASFVIASKVINKPSNTRVKESDIPAPSAPVIVEDALEHPWYENDTQLIAVISAALMAYQGSGKKLVVRSVRRVGTRSAWAEAGRREQLY